MDFFTCTRSVSNQQYQSISRSNIATDIPIEKMQQTETFPNRTLCVPSEMPSPIQEKTFVTSMEWDESKSRKRELDHLDQSCNSTIAKRQRTSL